MLEIRPMKPEEYHLLKEFTYQAIFQRDETNPVPYDVLQQPELEVFYKNFGSPHDHALLASVDGQPAGAVWTRIIDGPVKGFGNLDSQTPEFGISLFKKYRNLGIGTALMEQMLSWLATLGYTQASLAVQKDNYAFKMYQKVGFTVQRETSEEYIMVCHLTHP